MGEGKIMRRLKENSWKSNNTLKKVVCLKVFFYSEEDRDKAFDYLNSTRDRDVKISKVDRKTILINLQTNEDPYEVGKEYEFSINNVYGIDVMDWKYNVR